MYHSYQDCPIDFHMLHSKLYPSLMKSCSVIGLHSVTWPNITLLWCWWCSKQSADGIMHYSINVVIDMRSINGFSSIVCEKCYRYRPHRPLCKTLHACHRVCVHGVCTVLAAALCCAIERTTMVASCDSAEGNLNPQTPTVRLDRIPDKDLKVWLNRRVPQ